MSGRYKKLINKPEDIHTEMVEGYVAAYPDIICLDDDGLVVRATPKPAGKVGLVIGNGTGHEPAMIGWVGHGLFDVNVAGPLFTAPGPAEILAGIKAAERGAGVLLCVSHHEGDRLSEEQLVYSSPGKYWAHSVKLVTIYRHVKLWRKRYVTILAHSPWR